MVRHITGCLLGLLVFAACCTVTAQNAGPWGQCGGKIGCPDGAGAKACSNKQWPNVSCPQGYNCVRQDEWYWQCKEDSNFTAPRAVTTQRGKTQQNLFQITAWGQCGGINGCNLAADECGDWQWARCPSGYSCMRQDPYYYQCKLSDQAPKTVSETATEKQQPSSKIQASPKPSAPVLAPTKPADTPALAAAAATAPSKQQTAPQRALTPRNASPPAHKSAANAAKTAADAAAPPSSPHPNTAAEDSAAAATAAATAAAANETRTAVSSSPSPSPKPAATPKTAVTPNRSTSDATNATNTTMAEQQQVEFALEYRGLTAQQFQQQYAAGSLSAVSQISGIPADQIKTTLRPINSSGSRRLLQQQAAGNSGILAAYRVPTPNTSLTLQSIEAALANNGQGVYDALNANGVPLQPGLWLNGRNMVSASAAAATAAPAAAGSSRSSGDPSLPQWKKVAIGVAVGVGGFLLLLGLLTACWCCKQHRHSRKLDQQKQKEAGIVAEQHVTERPSQVGSCGGVAAGAAAHKPGQTKEVAKAKDARAADLESDTARQIDQGVPKIALPATDSAAKPYAAADSSKSAYYTPASTFESAAAAGAAAAALIDQPPVATAGLPAFDWFPVSEPLWTSEPAASTTAATAEGPPARAKMAAAAVPVPPSTSPAAAAPVEARPVAGSLVAGSDAVAVSTAAAGHITKLVRNISGASAGSIGAATSANKAPWKPPSGKYDIPPIAPPEHFPRSFNTEQQGAKGPTTFYPRAAPRGRAVVPAGGSNASTPGFSTTSSQGTGLPGSAGGSAVAAIAATVGAHQARPAPTPIATGRANDEADEGYQSGEEGFETPRSDASFKSARSAGGMSDTSCRSADERMSEASFKSANVGSEAMGSARSFQTAPSRAGSAATAMTAATANSNELFMHSALSGPALTGRQTSASAQEWPRAWVPAMGSTLTTTQTDSEAGGDRNSIESIIDGARRSVDSMRHSLESYVTGGVRRSQDMPGVRRGTDMRGA